MGGEEYLGDPVNVYTVNFAAANDSDTNQEWALMQNGDNFFIMADTEPRGFLMNVMPWLGTSEAPGIMWSFGDRGTINDTSFSNTTIQVSKPSYYIPSLSDCYRANFASRHPQHPPPSQQQPHHPLHTPHSISR
jgi:hypothetical protein